jgi:hypothetical protein
MAHTHATNISRPKCRNVAGVIALFAALVSGAVFASDADKLNSIIDGTNSMKVTKPAQGDQGSTEKRGDAELWVPSSAPLGSVQLIVARPEPNATCRDVIFKRRQPIPVRYTATAGKRLEIPLDQACWIGLRNGSDKREIVLRIGEALQKLSIVPIPQLVLGRALRPHEQVRIALRPLPIERLEIALEAVWMEDVQNGNKVQSMTFEFVGNR